MALTVVLIGVMAIWNVWFVALVIAAVLLHELGHVVAMNVLGYSNVQMLFLPLVGVSVSGKNRDVSSMRRAIVFLAGPLPGLVLATATMFAALATFDPWLRDTTFVLVLVNAFNLIPFLPLDGGRLVQVFRQSISQGDGKTASQIFILFGFSWTLALTTLIMLWGTGGLLENISDLNVDLVQVAPVDVTFVAPDRTVSDNIAMQLESYLQYGHLGEAIEPWSPLHDITPPQLRARETLARLMRMEREIEEAILSDGMDVSNTDASGADQLRRQAYANARREARNDIRILDHFESPAHLQEAGMEEALPANHPPVAPSAMPGDTVLEAAFAAWQRELGELLGRIPFDQRPASDDGRLAFAASGGVVSVDGNRVCITGMQFRHPSTGQAALQDWLLELGCQKIRFRMAKLDRW